jgi:hypothetical protein
LLNCQAPTLASAGVGSPPFRWRGRHLKSRGRVIALSGQEQLELDAATAKNEEELILPLIYKAAPDIFHETRDFSR